MTTVTTIAFSKLVAADEINAREDTKDGIADLAASIKAKGLIQPLAVRPTDGERYEIIDGRRRYRALALLVKEKAWKKADAVPVIVRNEDDAEALATSLIANTQRLPMHPVDQFTVFDRLVAQGRSEAQIASEFALSARVVKQRLALGRLAPEIRKAWKAGKIEEKVARAFTAHDSQDVQRAAFEKLRKQHGQYLSEHSVRHELMGGGRDTRDLPQAAIDRYLAAGGKLREDLFSDAVMAEDRALLETCVGQWAEAECAALKERLLGQGWSWVARHKELGVGDWVWRRWPHVIDAAGEEDGDDPDGLTWAVDPEDADAQSAKFTSEQKGKSGVVIEFYTNGATELHFGIVRPDEQTDIEDAIADYEAEDESDDFTAPSGRLDEGESEGADNEEGEDDDAGAPQLATAHLTDLTTAQTEAASRALAAHPRLALRVLLASLLTIPHGGPPAKVRLEGLASPKVARNLKFDAALLAVMKLDDAAIDAGLAELIGAALDLRTFNPAARRDSETVFVDALPAPDYLAAMRDRFLPADYFKRATKAHALAAIDEIREAGCAAGLAPEDVLGAMKKGELAAAAAAAAEACGWLPPELRHVAYSIPAAPSATQQKAA